MNIEYEATFTNVNKDDIRARLKNAGAILVKPEFLQKRINFDLPSGHEIKGGWLRVRDEEDKITMSLKIIEGNKIENQKEICLCIDSFSEGMDFLKSIGCVEKAYQETKREIWTLNSVEIMIDEWPYLEPFVEVEGKSEEAVKEVSKKLGFDYAQALFAGVDVQYNKKYGLDCHVINNSIPRIAFNEPNPFVNSR
ncbi:MAG: CYTH domain-containing protein [Patescibacteria group bacterium]|jgi:adenylate cyclase class 2